MITKCGVFDTLISDQGTEFVGVCTKEICRLLDMKQQLTPSFTHHCLGACERSQRTLAERMTPFIQNKKQWEDVLSCIVFSINNAAHAATNYAPFEILFGQRPCFPLSTHIREVDLHDIPNDYHSYIQRHLEKLAIIRDQIQQNSLESQIQMVERANQNQKTLALTKGDYVYLTKDPTGVGQKLKYRHAGPYVIEKVNSPHTFSLVDP